MIRFDFEKSMDEALKGLDLRDKRIKQAVNAANRKMVNWMNTRIKRVFKEATKISGAKFTQNKRLHKQVAKGRQSFSKIWVGLNPLKAHWVGGKALKKGVRAGGQLFPTAWWNEEKQIFFIRKPNGKLDVLKIPIPDVEKRLKRLKPIAEKQFQNILENQLDFRLK